MPFMAPSSYLTAKPKVVPPARYKATHCCGDPTHIQWWVTQGTNLIAVRATKTAAERLARELNTKKRVVREDGSITGYEPLSGQAEPAAQPPSSVRQSGSPDTSWWSQDSSGQAASTPP